MSNEIIFYDYEISDDCCNKDCLGNVCLKCGKCGRKFANGMLQKDDADNAEYIDRHALKNDGHLCWHDGKGNTFYEVGHAPIVDVVAVVRCKDCVAGEKTTLEPFVCSRNRMLVYSNSYCSFGIKGDA